MKLVIHLESTPRQRRTLRALTTAAIALATVGIGVALAAPKHTFAPGAKLSAQELNENFASVATPPGVIVAFGGMTVPDGWALCDGAQLDGSIAKYADLYAAIGIAFGGNKVSKQFHVPDFRGRFLRGATDVPTADRDPGGSARSASAAGGNTGPAIGSFEPWASAMPRATFSIVPTGGHAHGGVVRYLGGGAGTHYLNSGGDNSVGLGRATDGVGDHGHGLAGGDAETRPDNVSVNYMIKL